MLNCWCKIINYNYNYYNNIIFHVSCMHDWAWIRLWASCELHTYYTHDLMHNVFMHKNSIKGNYLIAWSDCMVWFIITMLWWHHYRVTKFNTNNYNIIVFTHLAPNRLVHPLTSTVKGNNSIIKEYKRWY